MTADLCINRDTDEHKNLVILICQQCNVSLFSESSESVIKCKFDDSREHFRSLWYEYCKCRGNVKVRPWCLKSNYAT